MDAFEELLRLYSEHSIEALEANGDLLLTHFQVAEPDALFAIDGYSEAFVLISSCATSVERLVAKYPDPADQARESIRIMRRMLDNGEPARKVDATRRLVEGRLYKEWPLQQQELYDNKKQIIEWRDFFVSYTNRDAPATNQQFRKLIKSCFGVAPKGEEAQTNHIAKVITRHLRRYQGLSGFFDEDNLKVGENIENEVDEYCARAFALVQLIEPLSFDKEPPRNWCFHEYKHFSENPVIVDLLGNKNRHFFILTAPQLDMLQPASPFPPYTEWYSRISTVKQEHISLDGERNTTLRTKIKKIATEILALRAEIVDAWLKQ
jgi:hypothetical protein